MGSTGTAIVIGAGVVGVTSAYALARRGWKVELVDAAPDVAAGASRGNGRQLSYSHTGALASPSLMPKLPKLALGCDPAFRLSLKPDLVYARWLTAFLWQCRRPAFARNTLECSKLASESRRAMDRLLDDHALSFGLRDAGKLVLLPDARAVDDARATLRLTAQFGQPQDILSRLAAIEIEPALEGFAAQFAGAVYAPQDQTADCALFCKRLLATITAEYGVVFRGGMRAVRIEDGKAESVVRFANGDARAAPLVIVAGGHEANRLLAPLGHRQAIAPMKGYSFTAPAGRKAPQVSITDSANRLVFTRLEDRILVAGRAELGETSAEVDVDRLQAMTRQAQAVMPDAADYSASDEGWAGIRPMTPNSLPVIRKLSSSLAINVGHGMLGWTLAMGSSNRLAQIVGSPA
ncbi:FAD-dependent oxidoreductase [Erythrobacter aquimaris]|uniref:FAD-dependent oxidoreductase n=1 Tax=Qipengyuania aquimaris TaxID=255984 RepID=A0A6I4TN01_9SPHN|nr:FAD-dependent oxidoreductase [Qipengyuania aquimaris]MXO96570.1 FAD-dependent oxidoreductase [Qipengyuania aquimaris]